MLRSFDYAAGGAVRQIAEHEADPIGRAAARSPRAWRQRAGDASSRPIVDACAAARAIPRSSAEARRLIDLFTPRKGPLRGRLRAGQPPGLGAHSAHRDADGAGQPEAGKGSGHAAA